MRRQDDVGEAAQRRVRRQRLDREHVEPGAGDPAAASASYSAASSTSPPRAVLITNAEGFISARRSALTILSVAASCGAWTETKSASREQLLEPDQLDALGLGIGRIGDRVVGQHAHLEAAAARGERAADPAEAEDADAWSATGRGGNARPSACSMTSW